MMLRQWLSKFENSIAVRAVSLRLSSFKKISNELIFVIISSIIIVPLAQ